MDILLRINLIGIDNCHSEFSGVFLKWELEGLQRTSLSVNNTVTKPGLKRPMQQVLDGLGQTPQNGLVQHGEGVIAGYRY